MSETKRPDRSAILATMREVWRLPAGELRIVVVDKEAMANVAAGRVDFPCVVLSASGEYRATAGAVLINGPSRLVPAPDSVYFCGEDHPNTLAVETEAEIVGLDFEETRGE